MLLLQALLLLDLLALLGAVGLGLASLPLRLLLASPLAPSRQRRWGPQRLQGGAYSVQACLVQARLASLEQGRQQVVWGRQGGWEGSRESEHCSKEGFGRQGKHRKGREEILTVRIISRISSR